MLSLKKPPTPVRPLAKSRQLRIKPKAEMNTFGLVCSAVALYSSTQWYIARLQRTRAEGKPMWPWEKSSRR